MLSSIDNELTRIDSDQPEPHFDHRVVPSVEGYPAYAWTLGLRSEITVRVRMNSKFRPARAEIVSRQLGSPAWLHGDTPFLVERLFDRASLQRGLELMQTKRRDGKPRNPDGEDFLLAWSFK